MRTPTPYFLQDYLHLISIVISSRQTIQAGLSGLAKRQRLALKGQIQTK
jgi:hypothetical protein